MILPRHPAPLTARIGAGLLDGLIQWGLATAYLLVPLISSGLVIPMWGLIAAAVGYTHLAGYTLLTKDFAARAGVDSSGGTQVQVRTGGKWSGGRLVTLPRVRLGGARAEGVLAAVVDSLPGGLDGILGVNFVWRFRVRDDGARLVLTPWPGVRRGGK